MTFVEGTMTLGDTKWCYYICSNTPSGPRNVATFVFCDSFFILVTDVGICRKPTEGQLVISESTILNYICISTKSILL